MQATNARLAPFTEERYAAWLREGGVKTREHRGRHWREMPRGFYQPVHWAARLTPEQATSPLFPSWGFRAGLREEDASAATGTIPLHLLSDLQGYSLDTLSGNRRSQVRRCLKRTEITQLQDPGLLQAQGYAVMRSAVLRAGYKAVESEQQYLTGVRRPWPPGSRFLLAAVVDGKLGGYLVGSAIDDTAYLDEIHVATDALASYAAPGLVFTFVQACQRTPGLRQVVYGLHSREDSSLCSFKEALGFPVRHLPARCRINPLAAALLRWRYPDKYYRLAGRPARGRT
jgi:hypothetical protein